MSQPDDRDKVYLGDSVYASFDGLIVKLCTNNGGEDENEIWFEPPTMQSLVQYLINRGQLHSFLPSGIRHRVEDGE